MFDSLTIAPPLVETGIERAQADVPADAIRQATDHGEHARPLRHPGAGCPDFVRGMLHNACIRGMKPSSASASLALTNSVTWSNLLK